MTNQRSCLKHIAAFIYEANEKRKRFHLYLNQDSANNVDSLRPLTQPQLDPSCLPYRLHFHTMFSIAYTCIIFLYDSRMHMNVAYSIRLMPTKP